jgi:hypothetical protein
MVFNATFNNISVISWRSVLLAGEIGVPRESHRPVASHWQTWSHDELSCQLKIWFQFFQNRKNIWMNLGKSVKFPYWQKSNIGINTYRGTQRKPPTCRKSLTNLITWCCIEYTSPWAGFELTTLVMIGTDCIGDCISNYHAITATTAVPITTKVVSSNPAHGELYLIQLFVIKFTSGLHSQMKLCKSSTLKLIQAFHLIRWNNWNTHGRFWRRERRCVRCVWYLRFHYTHLHTIFSF